MNEKVKKSKKRKVITIDLTVDNSNMDPLFLFKEKRSNTENDKDHLSSLPEELIFKIMTYLNPRDLIQFICISKKYYRLSKDEDLWKHMFSNCRINHETPLIKSMLKETGSWKSTFIKRYCQNQFQWDVESEHVYISTTYWASLSINTSKVFALTLSTLDVIDGNMAIQQIEYHSCKSQYSTFIKATRFPTHSVFVEIPRTRISYIFHDKKKDILIMYHNKRGILIFAWENSEFKLKQEISFQLNIFPVLVNMSVDYDNTLLILGISTSLYIFNYKQALNQEQATPIFSQILNDDIMSVSIGHGYAYWKSDGSNSALYKISTNEFIDISSIQNSILYTPIIRAYKDELYLISHGYSPKVNIININKKKITSIPCYKNIVKGVIPVYDAPEQFITHSREGIIKVWEVPSGKCIDVYSLSIHKSSIKYIFCKEDILIACSEDKKLAVWNILTKKQLFMKQYGSFQNIDYFNDKLIMISDDSLMFHKIRTQV